jgi:hypothetical protein
MPHRNQALVELIAMIPVEAASCAARRRSQLWVERVRYAALVVLPVLGLWVDLTDFLPHRPVDVALRVDLMVALLLAMHRLEADWRFVATIAALGFFWMCWDVACPPAGLNDWVWLGWIAVLLLLAVGPPPRWGAIPIIVPPGSPGSTRRSRPGPAPRHGDAALEPYRPTLRPSPALPRRAPSSLNAGETAT